MKQTKSKDQRQTELFPQLSPLNNSTLLRLPPARQVELEQTLAELLLNTACADSQSLKEADHDE